MKRVCKVCGKEFDVLAKTLARGWGKCCSWACRNAAQCTGKIVKCRVCGKEFYRAKKDLRRINFCSRSCACIHKNRKWAKQGAYPSRIHGNSSYRKRAFKHYGEKCANKKCPLRGAKVIKKMLDVHHIDGNRHNSKMKNLVVLCVWCHALVTRRLKKVEKNGAGFMLVDK